MRCNHHLFIIVLLILACGKKDIYCNALLPSPSLLASKRAWDCQTLVSVQKISNDDNNNNILGIVRGGDINFISRMKEGYNQRVSADPSFLSKSIIEVILAASTQYIAERSRRGQSRIIPEIDFVFAGILTAVCGKYYSTWRVARTVTSSDNTNDVITETKESSDWRDKIPNNAFQSTLLDGQTIPTPQSRFLSFILPMPNLFKAGFVASTLGYGLTALLIQLRTLLIPHYVAETKRVSVIGASIYTGVFMAFVSNIRYQLLQGVIEPFIDSVFNKLKAISSDRKSIMLSKLKLLTNVKSLTIILVRLGNGLLGSYIAITGMKAFGLQQLKE